MSELVSELRKNANGLEAAQEAHIGFPVCSAESMIMRRAANHITRLESDVAIMRKSLTALACFDDEMANEELEQCNSYSAFDEPSSVQIAREALSRISGEDRTSSGAPADAVQALVNQAPAGLGPSGFDPSRGGEPDPDCEYCFGSGSVETGGNEAHTAFSVACICTAPETPNA